MASRELRLWRIQRVEKELLLFGVSKGRGNIKKKKMWEFLFDAAWAMLNQGLAISAHLVVQQISSKTLLPLVGAHFELKPSTTRQKVCPFSLPRMTPSRQRKQSPFLDLQTAVERSRSFPYGM